MLALHHSNVQRCACPARTAKLSPARCRIKVIRNICDQRLEHFQNSKPLKSGSLVVLTPDQGPSPCGAWPVPSKKPEAAAKCDAFNPEAVFFKQEPIDIPAPSPGESGDVPRTSSAAGGGLGSSAIVGAVVGTLILVAFIAVVLVAFFALRRRNARQRSVAEATRQSERRSSLSMDVSKVTRSTLDGVPGGTTKEVRHAPLCLTHVHDRVSTISACE